MFARFALAFFAATLALTSSGALAQTMITVDQSQGPGFDFGNIPAAVAAAADGDVLVVRDGTYSNLLINGKSLTVVGEGPGVPHIQGASIRNLGPGQRALLVGLKLTSAEESALQIKNNTGGVIVEDCVVIGASGSHAPLLPVDGHAGAQIVNSTEVTFSGCTLTGGSGTDYSTVSIITIGSGAAGCEVTGPAQVALFGCTVTGGSGGNSEFDEPEWGGFGAPAISCNSTELSVIGCSLQGGDGGNGGYDDGGTWGGSTCGPGGDGGDGIYALPFGPTPMSPLRGSDNSYAPGQPGFGGFGCSNGTAGIDLDTYQGQLIDLGVSFVDLTLNSPLPETDSIILSTIAPPGTALYLGLSSTPGFGFISAFHGVSVVDLATVQILPLGVVDTSGQLTATFAGPFGVPPGLALSFIAQIVSLQSGTIALGDPASLLLLDV